jgi:hypothetical protein
MATRMGAKAIAYAKTITRWPVGYCLKFVRTCFNVSSKYPSAISAWNNAKYRHGPSSAIPAGVPVFFRGGKYGHVAISLGNGMCRSTDYPRAGVVSDVKISTLAAKWNYPYIGWSEDLNGVRVWVKPTAAPKVTPLSLSTKVGKVGWQVSDLRWVLYKAGFLDRKYVNGSDLYDGYVQAAVARFHKSPTGKQFADSNIKQIGSMGWRHVQRLAGRVL